MGPNFVCNTDSSAIKFVFLSHEYDPFSEPDVENEFLFWTDPWFTRLLNLMSHWYKPRFCKKQNDQTRKLNGRCVEVAEMPRPPPVMYVFWSESMEIQWVVFLCGVSAVVASMFVFGIASAAGCQAIGNIGRIHDEELMNLRIRERDRYNKLIAKIGNARHLAKVLEAVGIDLSGEIDHVEVQSHDEFRNTSSASMSYWKDGTIRNVHLVAIELCEHENVYESAHAETAAMEVEAL